MNRLLPVLMVALAAACGGEPELVRDTYQPSDSDRVLLTLAQLPSMPAYPGGRRGRLVVASAGDQEINGAFEAWAGLCETPRLLEIYATVPGTGTAILVHLPEGDPIGSYPVVPAQSGVHEIRTAQIGVQLFQEPEAYGFQALNGDFELTYLGEYASGRFAVTLQEIDHGILSRYVGVVEHAPVEVQPAEYCQKVREAFEVAGLDGMSPAAVPPGVRR